MNAFRIASRFAICSVALVSGLACRDPQQAEPRESAIQFVIRPGVSQPSDAPGGSFEVRGIDNDEHTRVGVGSSSAARTLRVRVPAGSYSVAWRPANGDLVSAATEATDASAQAWPQIVVVTTDGPATVNVHFAPRSTRAELRYELAAADLHAAR